MFIAIFFAITTIITAIIMINADRLAASKTEFSVDGKIVKEVNGQLVVMNSGRKKYFDKYTCPMCGEEVTSEAGQVQGEVLCAECEYTLFVGDDE